MTHQSSQAFQEFSDYVFGDHQPFHYNGLPAEIVSRLAGAEREHAAKQVLIALQKSSKDERLFRAAGFLQLREAVPILERALSASPEDIQPSLRLSCAWALCKITGKAQYMNALVDLFHQNTDGVTRSVAIDLLADLGTQPQIIDALVQALLDKELQVSQSAAFALRKIFQDDLILRDLLKDRNYAISPEGWSKIKIESKRYTIR